MKTQLFSTEWENKEDGSKGIDIHRIMDCILGSDSHTQQKNFHYCGQNGEIRVNQARRGYEMAMDDEQRPFENLNPLYMKYTPGKDGYFSGQNGYRYKSMVMIRGSLPTDKRTVRLQKRTWKIWEIWRRSNQRRE